MSFGLFATYICMLLIAEIPRTRMVLKTLLVLLNQRALNHSRSAKTTVNLLCPFNGQLLHLSQASPCSQFVAEKAGPGQR